MRARLMAMMFLQYFAMGAIVPILALALQDHWGFSTRQIGVILAMQAVSNFISPFIAARVADRTISSERLFALCHFTSGIAMIVLYFQTSFLAFNAVYLIYCLLFAPTSSLSNTVTFHHTPDAKKNYGAIRVWGTYGWMAVAWTFGFLWLRGGGTIPAPDRLPAALIVCGVSSILLSAFMLSFPKTIIEGEHRARPSFAATIKIMARPSLALLCILTFFGAIGNAFYIQWSSPYLRDIGIGAAWIMPVLTVGQVSEIWAMTFLGRLLARWGYKSVMLWGLIAQVTRFVLLAFFPATPVVVAAVFLHGFTWTLFFTAGYIYVDHHCQRHERAAAQQLYHMTTAAFGNLAGSLLAGQVGAMMTYGGAMHWTGFWCVPLGLALAAALPFALRFKDGASEPR